MQRVVFLSSTGKDLHEYREAVIAHLAKLDHFRSDAMEHFGARDASAIRFCHERVREADIYVGLIGLYRSWEPKDDNPDKRSITEMEYDWACHAPAKPRLLYVAPDDFVGPEPASLKGQVRRQAVFRKRLMSAHIVDQKHFQTPEALAAAVVRGLTNHVLGELLLERASGERAKAGNRSDPFAAAVDAAEQAAADENIEPAALAQRGVDVAEIEAKLAQRAAAHEAKGRAENRISARYRRQIGALAFLHDTQKALGAYTKATALEPDDPEGWNQLGVLQLRAGELDEAISSFERVLALGNRTADQKWIAIATGNLGIIYWTRGDLDQAEAMCKKSLAISEPFDMKELSANQYGNLGNIYRTRGDLDQAEAMYKKALALNKALGRKEGMANQYGNLGLIYQTRGDLERAEAMSRRALVIYEALGRKESLACLYGNLGVIYSIRGELGQAEAMYRKSLAISEPLDIKKLSANQYGNLGNIYQARGDLEQAEAMFRKVLVIDEGLGRKESVATTYGNLGNLYRTRGDLDQAEAMYRKALTIDESLSRKEGIARHYGNLGILCQKKGDMVQVCAYWRKARDLYVQIGIPKEVEKVEGWLRRANCPAA